MAQAQDAVEAVDWPLSRITRRSRDEQYVAVGQHDALGRAVVPGVEQHGDPFAGSAAAARTPPPARGADAAGRPAGSRGLGAVPLDGAVVGRGGGV